MILLAAASVILLAGAGLALALRDNVHRGWASLATQAAASVLVGTGAGVALGRAAFDAPVARPSPESLVSGAFGPLPFGSPASGLTRAFAGAPGGVP